MTFLEVGIYSAAVAVAIAVVVDVVRMLRSLPHAPTEPRYTEWPGPR